MEARSYLLHSCAMRDLNDWYNIQIIAEFGTVERRDDNPLGSRNVKIESVSCCTRWDRRLREVTALNLTSAE